MERLTKRDIDGCLIHPWSFNGINGSYDIWDEDLLEKQIDRLAAYEDTGLEPEEIADFMKRWERSVEIAGICKKGGIDHLLELKKAEQAGRLVVLPFQQGKTLVDRTFPENPQLLKNIRVAVAYDSSGIIFHYPFNTFIQNVKSGCIYQVSEEAEAALDGKDNTAPDAPEEPMEPEWKERVMRTFLGGR